MSGGLNVPNVNAVTVTANSSGFSVAGGSSASKTLTVSNSVTIAGTDSSTLNIGAGGTLQSGAFQVSSQGTTGAQGVQGTTGIQGSVGTQGALGTQGSTGAQGTVGGAGIQGSTGSQGTGGAQGATGSQGAQGVQGTQGRTGAQGSTGTQGAVGSTGGTGATGSTGVQGTTGATGAQGTSGATILGNTQTWTGTNTFNVLNMTGKLGIDNPADYSSTAITSLTSAPIDSQAQYDPSAGTSAVYFPMIHQTALYNSGYRTHTSYGLYKASSAWTAGHYFAIGDSDSYPTQSFFLNYGGSISHTQGFVTTSGSSRSPIFYDSDDTGYYCDPASTSRLNAITYTNMYSSASSAYGFFGNNVYVDTVNSGGVGDPLELCYARGAYTTTSGSMRAPIFYDTDNTAFYLNPAGSISIMTGELQIQGPAGNTHLNYSQGGGNNYFRGYSNYFDVGVTYIADARAYIYYDWNDTSYYLNPNSSSVLRTISNKGWLYIDENYGHSVVGVYNSTIFQGVFAMGDSYKLTAGGGINNLYGIAWSHPNAGGIAGNLDSHGLIVAINGGFGSCMAYSIKASSNVTAYSDERLKKDWADLPKNYVEQLAKIKVGTYTRIDGEKLRQVGVSAQSLKPLLPEAVIEATDDFKTLSVAYGNAAMASAVELAKEVVTLKEQLNIVMERLKQLENK
jgi:hypothetical protein